MLMRRMTIQGAGWDDPVPETDRNEWIKFFNEMFEMEKITFNRSTKPDKTVGKPVLVLFSDASKEAFGACAYAR